MKNCEKFSALKKLKLNNIEILEKDFNLLQNIFIDQGLFPELTSLEFYNMAFDFKDNNDLQSFFFLEKFKYPPLIMPNLSYFIMKEKNNNLKDIEEFCKNHRS